MITPVLAVAVSFFVDPRFSASATFVAETPTGGSLPPTLAGAAATLGLSLPSGENKPPQFYAQVLTGRAMIRAVLRDTFPGDGRCPSESTCPLIDQLGIAEDDSLRRMEFAERELSNLVSADVDPRNSGIVTVVVQAPTPLLASQVTARLVQKLNEFLLASRRQAAAERRDFLQTRMGTAQHELRQQEAELRAFYEGNRRWQDSPELVFEEGALRRQVDLAQALYLTIAREYESVRVEEANSTPIISVIDEPVPPTQKSYPRRAQIAFLGAFLGAVVGVTIGLIRDFWSVHGAAIRSSWTEPIRGAGDGAVAP